MQRVIRIENARSHNLRGIDCEIPLGRLTVITGPSGSGKTTLAFDTLYAEGQRRYVSSLSAYARQFLDRLPRPEVDHVSNLPPAIAIEQRNGVTNARSTVGSATEVLDQLRLLFARIGTTICPDCDEVVDAGGIVATADRIATEWPGARVQLVAPVRSGRGRAGEVRDELVKEGFARLLADDGKIVDLLEQAPRAKPSREAPWWLLVDRIDLRDADGARARLIEAVSQGFAKGQGELEVRGADGLPANARRYREGRVCNRCGRRFPEPSPGLFSFNNALGACPRCEGFGRIAEIDWDRVVPDPGKSLAGDAVALFSTGSTRGWKKWLLAEARKAGIDVARPFAALSDDERRWVLEGDGARFEGVKAYFEWLEGRRYKVQARVQLARHRKYEPCPDCEGTRLSEAARAVRIEGRSLADLGRSTLEALQVWTDELAARGVGGEAARRLLELIGSRLRTIHAVGLGYVALDRTVRSLSGGEAQRIQLATALSGSLTSSLYVLDEPSVGLHVADLVRLLRVLEAIRDQGNTVVVVEHALPLIEAADHVLDLGPGAGRHGGTLVCAGSVDAIRASASSKTGAALRGTARPPARRRRDLSRAPRLRIATGRIHNLQDLEIELPLGALVALTGVSGAGKSTLVREVLVPGLAGRRGGGAGGARGAGRSGRADAGPRIEGASALEGVVLVDQSPGSRSARSNPATVTKAWDAIRTRFAETREARARGYRPGFFSFNVAGGRCEACEGAGEVEIDMQFLDDLRIPCEACGGKRFRKEVLDVRLDGRSIVDVLALRIDEACEVFAQDAKIVDRLRPLVRVGLGYLSLGQPLSTLSGGEFQRLRLGQALLEGAGRTLYVFDEPTTGLHASDVDVLLDCFDEVIEAGASVLVVEHDLEVIARADWVVDLGPGGGPDGGRLVAEGPPERVAASPASLTGRWLAAHLQPGGSGVA
ncbi:MAG: excinuclease ABC subunit UvrA [Myxococcota bacterium]